MTVPSLACITDARVHFNVFENITIVFNLRVLFLLFAKKCFEPFFGTPSVFQKHYAMFVFNFQGLTINFVIIVLFKLFDFDRMVFYS